MKNIFFVVLSFFVFSVLKFVHSFEREADIWPYPQSILQTQYYYEIRSNISIIFSKTAAKSDIVKQAVKRAKNNIFNLPCSSYQQKSKSNLTIIDDPYFKGQLHNLTISVQKVTNGYPSWNSNEMYSIEISLSVNRKFTGIINSFEEWGMLYGLETFLQLTYSVDGRIFINETMILDYPRFPFRGVLIDTARHFIPIKYLKQNIDAMAANKMNVFHWHIVDDQSFPYESKLFPNMSNIGSFTPKHIYTQKDVHELIEYARYRGIRVIPEFDTPGHSLSWKSIPNLLTQCYNGEKIITNSFGPINPIYKNTYLFLKKFFKEIITVFPDKYIHLGGDEVDFSCWESNPFIRQFMQSYNFSDYIQLQDYYMTNLIGIMSSLNRSYIVWEEIFHQSSILNKDTIFHVWQGKKDYYDEKIKEITSLGYRVILSSPWYLNYISYGPDWKIYYKIEPLSFNGSNRQKSLVMGGELCMWSEYVDGTNVISRTWPRGSAVAERLWSPKERNNLESATRRINKQRCRMLERGLKIEPVTGPGFCICDYAI